MWVYRGLSLNIPDSIELVRSVGHIFVLSIFFFFFWVFFLFQHRKAKELSRIDAPCSTAAEDCLKPVRYN